MNTEKDMLKQDLERQQKPEDIRQFIEDTKLMGGHEDIIELAKAKLEGLEKTVEEITLPVEITEAQEAQVENNEGSKTELNEITQPIEEQINKKDEEINNVKNEAEEKIQKVDGENNENQQESKKVFASYSEILRDSFTKEREREITYSEKELEEVEKGGELSKFEKDPEILSMLQTGLDDLKRFNASQSNLDYKEVTTTLNRLKSAIKSKYYSLDHFSGFSSTYGTGNPQKPEHWSMENFKTIVKNSKEKFENDKASLSQEVNKIIEGIEANKKFIIERDGEQTGKDISTYEEWRVLANNENKGIGDFISDNLGIKELEEDGKTKNPEFEKELKKLQNTGDFYRKNLVAHGVYNDDARKIMPKLNS